MLQTDYISLTIFINMGKYITSLFSLIVFGLIACDNQPKQQEKQISFQREDFKKSQVLTGKTIEFDNIVLRPIQLQLFDSILVTCNTGAEKLFHVFNLNTRKKIGEHISAGQGPKEMMAPRFVNRDDSVVVFDMMTSTLLSYSIPEFITENEPEFTNRVSLDTKPLWSNIRCLGNDFIGVSYQEDSPCYLFDKSGKKIMNFGTYPQTEQAYTPAELVNAFRADLTTDRKGRVAVTHYFTDLIRIYNKEGILEKELRGPDHFASVFKEFKDGDIIGSKADPQTYRDAFYSPVCVGDRIFVLYNGQMLNRPDYNILCKELFVIGWDGSLECRYTLDQGVSAIAVDEQRQKIYGISDDPEYHIVEFDY